VARPGILKQGSSGAAWRKAEMWGWKSPSGVQEQSPSGGYEIFDIKMLNLTKIQKIFSDGAVLH